MKSDADLVLEARRPAEGGGQARGESERAFSELVNRYKEKAIQMAFVTVGNFEEAKDVSQEAFVKAYRSLDRFELRSSFSTWFYRILMNAAKDHLRKRRWKNFLTFHKTEEMENYFEGLPDPRPSPGRALEGRELGEKTTEALKRLPLRQRWMFTLRFIEGLSLAEISRAAGVSEGAVKAALHFATQKFKKEMKAHGF